MIALILVLVVIILILMVLVLNTMFVVKINSIIEKNQLGEEKPEEKQEEKPEEKPEIGIGKIIGEEPMTDDNGVLLAPVQFKN